MTTVPLREAKLSWKLPTVTSASISGYKIHQGIASKNYSQTVSVSGASTLQRTIVLTPGTWYFAVSAIDTKGAVIAKSNEVSKFIP